MTRMRNVMVAASLSLLTAACGGAGETSGPAAAGGYAVDPLWPEALPGHWILGSVTGLDVDGRDHIWIVHRGQASLNARTEATLALDPPGAEFCCLAAPPVLEFDRDGVLAGSWGGPGEGYDWPQSPGGLDVDDAGNVWITGAGAAPSGGRGGARTEAPPPSDAHVLKFSRTGQFLLQIGTPGETGGADSTTGLDRPSGVAVDSDANEVYVADTGNRRVVVFDAGSGEYRRHWGMNGEAAAADDPGVTCVEIGPDDLVYVCNRAANRVQVFERDGTFVRQAVLSTTAGGDGGVWDLAFGAGTMFVANGQEQHVAVVDPASMTVTGTIGGGGRMPGFFYAVGSVALDSAGNVYTGEALEGKRVQKFLRRQP